MTDVAKQALAVTEKNLKASFEHARKLMQAKDINELMQLQCKHPVSNAETMPWEDRRPRPITKADLL